MLILDLKAILKYMWQAEFKTSVNLHIQI